MKKGLFLLVVFPLVAIAGKAEREYMKNEVEPARKAAEAEFKKACGCALKITVDSSVKSTDDMYQAKHISNSIKDGAAGYCTDAESKKAICKMKTLTIKRDKETKFAFSGGKGTASTDGQSYASWDMMTQELDK